jgi:hypothetical protein
VILQIIIEMTTNEAELRYACEKGDVANVTGLLEVETDPNAVE